MAARVITERDVLDGKVGDPIVVDLDTVITPSALDAADARGLRVEFRRGAQLPPRVLAPCPMVPAPTTPTVRIGSTRRPLPRRRGAALGAYEMGQRGVKERSWGLGVLRS